MKSNSSLFPAILAFLGAALLVVAVIAFVFGICVFFGWLTMIALGVVGIKTTLWPATAVYVVLSVIFSAARKGGRDD